MLEFINTALQSRHRRVSPQLLQPGIPYFGAIALVVILSGGARRLRLSDVAVAAPRGIALGLVA